MAVAVDKSPDAFRTISEVADDLDLPQHVLRFWEGRFAQIRPLKRGGGRRYYRPDDVDLLKGIRHLLYGEGYTIRGVQRILKEQGVRFVMTVWHEGAPQVARNGGAYAEDDGAEDDFSEAADPFEDEPAEAPVLPMRRGEMPTRPAPFREAVTEDASAATIAQRFAPRLAEEARPRQTGVQRPQPPMPRATDMRGRLDTEPDAADPQRSPLGALIDRFRSPAMRGEAEAPALVGEAARLSREEIRHLQSTLFELLECKRLLDQAR